jgi:hypothetical protein
LYPTVQEMNQVYIELCLGHELPDIKTVYFLP